MQVDQNGPTQKDLALKAMFVKGENLARRAQKRRSKLLLSPDGTPAYLVNYDRNKDPYRVYRDVSWFVK